MRSLVHRCLLLGLLLHGLSARADDPKRDSITVQQWTDVNLVFTTSERKLTFEVQHFFSKAGTFHFKATAPLDEATRVASFVANNQLIAPFKVELALGWDTRQRRLQELVGSVKSLKRYLKMLQLIPADDAAQKKVCRAQNIDPCTGANIFDWIYRNKIHGPDADDKTLLSQVKAWICGVYGIAPAECGYGKIQEVVGEKLNECDPMKPAGEQGICGDLNLATFIQRMATINHAVELFQKDPLDEKLAKEIWEYYVALKPGIVKPAGISYLEAIAGQIKDGQVEEIEKAFLEALQTQATQGDKLAARDLVLVGQTSRFRHVYGGISGDLVASYDSLRVYRDDLASKPVSVSKYDIQVGASGSVYWPNGTYFNVRPGLEIARNPNSQIVERCVAQYSSGSTVTGRTCDTKAMFLMGPLPAAEARGYVRLAVGFQYLDAPKSWKFIPGLEGRLNVENLGQGATLVFRGTGFVTPVANWAAGRAGLGIEVARTLEAAPDKSYAAGEWTVVPFVFVGGTGTLVHR